MAALLVQWLLIGRLQIWGGYADLALLFVAWTALRHGRLGGSVAGFTIGFAMDAIYGSWGLQAFVKTLVGFLVGLFVSNERESLLYQPRRAFIGALVTGLLQNVVLASLLAIQTGIRANSLILFSLVCSILTALLGALLALFGVRIRTNA